MKFSTLRTSAYLCVSAVICFSHLFTAETQSNAEIRRVEIQRASISVDARKVGNRISPLLYGQFLEFMYEGIKGGLHAELIRNRSFEEPANAIGLSRN